MADALLPRHALYYACLGEAFDGREAARIGLVNFSVDHKELHERVLLLAKRLMSKSPRALRATKQAMKQVRTMDVPQAYEYLTEKSRAMKLRDKDDSYNAGLRQFLDDKSYKPAFESFKLKTP